ncbi:hypothetical protein ALC57_01992 [Trachymyrmex cornetzi]|uniref:Endonuclease/exonuclease/phosphatase domain-containing protein n=1 Tax=Trachymyrmex cornetzi TaxID=471704 RepID=A0A151JPE5_9HYME|nr:hypothetical protein ALC57_01992 [Trachymyrmex cornetzi]
MVHPVYLFFVFFLFYFYIFIIIKILLWNCRGYKNKKQELSRNVDGYDVIVLMETKCPHNSGVYISGYRTYQISRGSLRVNDFRPLFDFDPGGCESIFLGDFNAHNTLWNCEYMDTIGESLQEAMERRDFMCVNMDTSSRIGAIGERDSNLDLLFCSAVLDNIEYNQLDDTWDSDHFPIVFKLATHRGIYSKRTNRITTKKTDWNKYAVSHIWLNALLLKHGRE